MAEAIELLLRQQHPGSGECQVFLAAAGRKDAFVLPLPQQLLTLQRAWRQRFLRHHDPAFAWPDGGAVVRSYSERLRQGLQQWLESAAWQPLQQLLAEQGDGPVLLRFDGVDPALSLLPWEAVALQRPIWRVDGQHRSTGAAALRARRPRILLLVGAEQGLDLAAEVEQLEQQQRSGRIHLTVLRGADCTPAALRAALQRSAGWDALLYLGHSSAGGNGGVLHLGDGSELDGEAIAADLAAAARHGLRLLLLNSCSGLQLAQHAARAGIDWAVCALELLPAAAAALAFSQLLAALEGGDELLAALATTRQQLAVTPGCEGCELLLAAVAAPAAAPFHLPMRRRRQLLLRLAHSSRRQAVAALALSSVALAMELTPANPLNSYLLNRRLEVQRLWRQWTGQGGPAVDRPLPVLLLDPLTTIPALGVVPAADHTTRMALAAVLERTPPEQVPLVGLDVVFDRPQPGSEELAAVLRRQRQRGRRVVGGVIPPLAAPCQGPSGGEWLASSALAAAGLEGRSLAVGTAGDCGPLKPVPLQLVHAITADSFAGALSEQPAALLPADRVIDWSINWAEQITLVQPAQLGALEAPLLLVGSSGRVGDQAVDLFTAPAPVQSALLRGDRPLWRGNAREVPGVLVQAVLIQSLNLQHWLTPLSQTLCTAAAAGLGVVVAAVLETRRQRLISLVGIALLSCVLGWSLAIWQLWLVPLLLPLVALGATALSRDG